MNRTDHAAQAPRPVRAPCPNAFILGAAKCGTTTLHLVLDAMPDVCASRPKEPFFFEAEYDRGAAYYAKTYFAHWQGEPVVVESRHRNLYFPYVPERLHATAPEARLVVLLRDPVERCHSHWWHHFSRQEESFGFARAVKADIARIDAGFRGDTPREISDTITRLDTADGRRSGMGIYRTYVDSGYYAEQLERYLARFSRDRLLVVFLDDLERRPVATLDDVIAFLGLDPERNRAQGAPRANAAIRNPCARWPFLRGVPFAQRLPQWAEEWLSTQPAMSRRMRKRLTAHYAPHDRRLAELLGQELPWRPGR